MRFANGLLLIAAVAALSACGTDHSKRPAASAPARFTTKVENPWMPLVPGTTLTYEGTSEGDPERDVFRVTSRTKVVGGVRCVVIDDRVYSKGHLSERTNDYYSQDTAGNVWYFGEDTAELDAHGRVTSTEGSWHTGVDGAKAGLFMPAHPRVGEQHRQEFYRGHAEDQFRVANPDARVKVPYGDFAHALRTEEWTRLEPGVLDEKYYARGIGEVSEATVKGPSEVQAGVAQARLTRSQAVPRVVPPRPQRPVRPS
jgi:hypothetical protein